MNNETPKVFVEYFTKPTLAGSIPFTRDEMDKFNSSLVHAGITGFCITAFPFAIVKISDSNFGVFVEPTEELPCKFIHNIHFVAGGTIESCCEYINEQLKNASVGIYPQMNVAEIKFSVWEDAIDVEYEDTYTLLSTIQNEKYYYFVNILGYKARIENSEPISSTETLINMAINAFNKEDEQTRVRYLSDVLTNGITHFSVKVETATGFETYVVRPHFCEFKLGRATRYKEYLDTYHFRLD